MITGINHSGVVVNDLERAIKFSRDALGLSVLGRRERTGDAISKVVGYEGCHLKVADLGAGDGHVLELVQYLDPPPAERPTEERSVLGGSHVAFDVEDIVGTYEELVRRGARKLNSPVEVAPGRTACYLQDPDGNWIELVELTG